MLSRRQLRIKVMESLYAYQVDEDFDEKSHYSELIMVFNHILDLYYHQLALLLELRRCVEQVLEKARQKHIPSPDDLNPNMRFVNNAILLALEHDKTFRKLVSDRRISWEPAEELIRKTARNIRESSEYADYLKLDKASLEEDRKYLKRIFKKQVMENEMWGHYYGELRLHWASNLDIANRLVLDTIDDYQRSSVSVGTNRSQAYTKILSKDDEAFVKKLFERTVKNGSDFKEWIAGKAQNWESDRIAVIDMILMKMALCEILMFPVIPVKVTINEYIEMSKQYSGTESKAFINGVLDKIIADLRKDGKIKKRGKGLIES